MKFDMSPVIDHTDEVCRLFKNGSGLSTGLIQDYMATLDANDRELVVWKRKSDQMTCYPRQGQIDLLDRLRAERGVTP